jgi:hypothetical protein
MMTTKPESPLCEAIAHHTAVKAAYRAAEASHDEESASHLSAAEDDACAAVAATPCASDEEFMKELRYLLTRETRLWGWPSDGEQFTSIVYAVATHLGVSYDRDT